MKTQTVRIDKETYNLLAKNRKGWETPNQVIKRLLAERDSLTINNSSLKFL